MKNIYKVLIFLVIGVLQMGLGHWIGVHDGLDHMVYTSWMEYAFEALFYSGCWSGIYYYMKNN